MDTQLDDNAIRHKAAIRINALSQSWTENTIEIGLEFSKVRETFPNRGESSQRPGWHAWVREFTNWHPDHVGRLIRVSDRFGSSTTTWSSLTNQVLRYLASTNIPDEGVEAVAKKVQAGEKITLGKAKEIVKPHLPTRKEAIKQARETGKLVASRDGHMYSGASEDEMLAYSERRKIVYAIRRAVDEIATVELTPNQWVNSAEDHWVHEFKLSHVEDAIAWLTKLVPLLSKRQKVVDNGTR